MFEHRQIFCHIRFSFFGVTDTRLKPADHDAALVQLYNETRMARRFFLFENLTLPSLRAQTDTDFKIVIMSSDIMPDRFKDRLRALTAQDSNISIDFSNHRNGGVAFRQHIDASLGEGFRKTAVHFRLDDDDALASSYIARLRAVSHMLSVGTHITFPTGLSLFPRQSGSTQGGVIAMRQFLHSVGLATICGAGFRKNPFQMMHGIVWQRWPVVSDPTFPSFIRVHHYDNDTVESQDKVLAEYRQSLTGRKAADNMQRVDDMLGQEFAFITQAQLVGLIGDLALVGSLADLPAV